MKKEPSDIDYLPHHRIFGGPHFNRTGRKYIKTISVDRKKTKQPHVSCLSQHSKMDGEQQMFYDIPASIIH